jgi:hypothetical protein
MRHHSNLLELIIERQNSSTKISKLFKSGGLKIDLQEEQRTGQGKG